MTTDTTPTETSTATASALTQGRRADSARRRQRVLKALNDATNNGDEISVSAIARRAGVDRTFLYRHRDLLEQVHVLEAEPPNNAQTGPALSRASLQADLLNAQQRFTRLNSRVQQLEKRLSTVLGEQAWNETGLGAPDDIDELKQQIVQLEQRIIDQRLQHEEHTQDLAAARAANRELMTQLNAARNT
jgi:chromosome segregation ATPase